MKKQLVAACVGWVLSATAAQAALQMSFQEADGRVSGTMAGSLDLTGMAGLPGFTSIFSGLNSRLGAVNFGQSQAAQTNFLGEIDGPASFGSGFWVDGVSTGDAVSLAASNGALWVPEAYESGAPLAGTLLFDNASLASLGVIPGAYVYTLTSGDTLTVQFSAGDVPPAQVPVPGSVPLMLAALGALAWSRRRSH